VSETELKDIFAALAASLFLVEGENMEDGRSYGKNSFGTSKRKISWFSAVN